MRKQFIFVVLIPVAIIAIIVYLFMDRWVEAGLESAAENVVGAKVEIDNLHVHLFPVGIDWVKMQVADPRDPWKNLFQTNNVRFYMNSGQLLRGKIIIETIEVHDLLIGTKRTTDGSLHLGKNNKSVLSNSQRIFSNLADNTLKEITKSTPIFDITKLKSGFKPDSLLKAFDFKTVKHIDTLKAQAEKTYKQWDLVKSDFENSKNRLIEIQNKIKAINPSQLNNIQNITSAISTVDDAVKSVNDIQNAFKDRANSISNNINSLAASVDSIDDFANEDFQKLKDMAKLPSINMPTIASLLAGNEMYEKAKMYLYWVDFARANIKKYQPKPEYTNPPRMKGQNIAFPVMRSYPKLWIKKILISGGTAGSNGQSIIDAQGEIDNISNNQSVTGFPITVSLSGVSNKRALELNGLFDRRKDIPFDQYSASLSGVPVGQFELGKSDFLPTKITDAVVNTSVQISVPGNKFDSKIGLKFDNTHFVFEKEPRNIGERIAREVLSGVSSFDINLRLWNTKGKFDVALSTNLDDQLTKKLTAVLGAEFVKLQNDLKNKFDSFISQKKNQFEGIYNKKNDEIKSELNSYTSLINENLSSIDSKKKELVNKLEKQKSGIIEDKLKDLLKK